MRTRLPSGLAALALVLTFVVLAAPVRAVADHDAVPVRAAADEPVPEDDPVPQIDLTTPYRTLAAQVSRNNATLAHLSVQLDAARARLAQIAGAIAETQQQLQATRDEVAQLRQLVRDRAAYIYRRAQRPQLAIGDIGRLEDLAAGRKYADSATRTDGQKIGDLSRQADALDARDHDLDAEDADQQAEQTRLAGASAELAAVTARQQKVLDQAGAIPVMGDAELTVDDITDWFDARGARYHLAGGTTIRELVALYLEEGAAEHIRPELAFAQSVLETGSFANATDNNYGGIGACDSCNGEIAFPTPRDGVRGQMQLLRNFADPASRAAGLAHPPSPQIFGRDPVAAAASFDSYVAKGRIPTWNVMGNGNWATDPVYSQKVLVIYLDMMIFSGRRT
jgi:hypothetical protein